MNGKSLGTQHNDIGNAKTRNQLRWFDVEYHAGYLEAIARSGGAVVARHKIETTGMPVRLAAQADRPATATKKPAADAWRADGQDLLHVRVAALDNKGRQVAVANNKVTFSVEGNARIVGVVNGDINSDELTVGNTRSLYNGTCTVILRSTRQAGNVSLTASAEGMKPVTMKLQTR